MANLIFPPAPTTGQEFIGTFGEIYTWDGEKWTLTSAGPVVPTPPPAAVGPTPPASPITGALWFNTANNTLNVWNGTAWVPVAPSTPVSLSGTQVPIVFFFPGLPVASLIIPVAIAIAITIPANFVGSQATQDAAATAAATFNVLHNGTNAGTIVVNPTGAPTWTTAGFALAVGDVLAVEAPTTQDTTLAGPSFTILATRT